MKSLTVPFLLFLLANAACLFSAVVSESDKEAPAGQRGAAYNQETEAGPHHRRRLIQNTFTNELGQVSTKASQYVEVQSGMHYFEDGAWKESQELVQVEGNTAVARQGAHKVTWAANINTAGAIDLVTPDNKRLRSHVIGLSYYDTATGESVLFAPIQDSVGQVFPPNRVIYRNAFSGARADLVYIYRKSGMEQDVVLIDAPPSPADFGLDPETTRLEVITEFIQAEQPGKTASIIRQEKDAGRRATLAEPDFIDETLDFGAMKFGQGRAFELPAEDDGEGPQHIPVAKSWKRLVDDRDFLIEAIEYRSVRKSLEKLPQREARVRDGNHPEALLQRQIPSMQAAAKDSAPEVMVAAAPYAEKGFVVDYVTTSDASNFTFKGNTTYFVGSSTSLSGTTTIEPSTVIKLGGFSGGLSVSGSILCKTEMYRPAFFVHRDDNSIGEKIEGSDGTPDNSDWQGLWFGAQDNIAISNVHFRHTYLGFYGGTNNVLTHCQFFGTPYYAPPLSVNPGTLALRNVLFYQCGKIVQAWNGAVVTGEHLTASAFTTFNDGDGSLYLTNSLIVGYWGTANFQGINNFLQFNAGFVLQTAEHGKHYLLPGSLCVDGGTTNINASLLADIRKRTTTAPWLLQKVDADTTLEWSVPLDAGLPDIGYHYAPLDYVAASTMVTNATLTVAAGTRIANRGPGLILDTNSAVRMLGTPLKPIKVVDSSAVQEDRAALGATVLHTIFSSDASYNKPATVSCEFVEFEVPYVLYMPKGTYSFSHCLFFKNNLRFLMPAGTFSAAFTNCLFDTVWTTYSTHSSGPRSLSASYWNNSFIGGYWDLPENSDSTALLKDNLFLSTALPAGARNAANNYNAYLTNQARFSPSGANDKILTSLTLGAGPLGSHYLPTGSSLINAGSRTAASASLYHFATTTNQTKEATSTVDIGFHYVALNGSSQPVDSDSDGVPDYQEDKNGNGSHDTAQGEAHWNSANTQTGGPVSMQVHTPLK